MTGVAEEYAIENRFKLGHMFISPSHINGLVQDCGNSIVLTMELLQSCTKPLICIYTKEDSIEHKV